MTDPLSTVAEPVPSFLQHVSEQAPWVAFTVLPTPPPTSPSLRLFYYDTADVPPAEDHGLESYQHLVMDMQAIHLLVVSLVVDFQAYLTLWLGQTVA